MSIMTETHCSYSELRHIDFSNASLGSCQLVDCKFKEGIGIESINADVSILKDYLSDTYLNDAEGLRNYINEF